MKKILLSIDAINPDKNTLDFACYLAGLTRSKLTGVFLENLVAEEKPVLNQLQGITYVDWKVEENSEEHVTKMELVDKNITFFKEACLQRDVPAKVHRDRGVPAGELIEESKFSDLIVINSETSFNKRYEGCPTDFARGVLKNAHCPVIIAPGNFTAVDELIFTYDKSDSSIFAIKQFSYLFPEFQNKKVSILHVNEKGNWQGTDKYKFKEWLAIHYKDFHFETKKGNSETKLFDSLFNRENIMIIMGAYGRNAISQFFQPSRADLLINTVSQPLFIAHH